MFEISPQGHVRHHPRICDANGSQKFSRKKKTFLIRKNHITIKPVKYNDPTNQFTYKFYSAFKKLPRKLEKAPETSTWSKCLRVKAALNFANILTKSFFEIVSS